MMTIIRTIGPRVDDADRVLATPALAFVEDLSRRFSSRIGDLLERRRTTHERFHAGAKPDFVPETAGIRQNDWRVGSTPEDLLVDAVRRTITYVSETGTQYKLNRSWPR